MTRSRWLVVGSCGLLVVGGLVGYAVRGGGDGPSRSDLTSAHAANAALAARLRQTRADLQRRLSRARSAAATASAYTRVMQRELLSAQGGTSQIGFCSSRDFPTVDVRVLAPTEASTVSSPVIAHLIVDKPLGCEAEYYVTVDGNLYRPVHHFARVAPVVGPTHPDDARPVPGNPSTPPPGACFGGVWEYIRFQLPAGDHVLAVSGACAQGTEVPAVTATPVHFTVAG